MEKIIQTKSEFDTLQSITNFLKQKSAFNHSMVYDSWDVRSDENGQMEKCILIKKSNMHGLKLYFSDKNQLKLSYIIPNKLMHAYFGKSVKQRQNILEIITGLIKSALLSPSQNKAFKEMAGSLHEISA